MPTSTPPTISQVNKAGKTLRHWMQDREDDVFAVQSALDVLLAFRAAHQRPLTTANMGLRSVVRTVGCDTARVSQRLKRVPTIVEKLGRENTLALSRMQDIGGCRAVLATRDEVHAVRTRVLRNKPDTLEVDYIANPKPDGYRGIHLIVNYHGRPIELQLRTQIMHQWAVTVEGFASVYGTEIKSGRGPAAIHDLLSLISEAMSVEESGGTVDASLVTQIETARDAARSFLIGGTQ